MVWLQDLTLRPNATEKIDLWGGKPTEWRASPSDRWQFCSWKMDELKWEKWTKLILTSFKTSMKNTATHHTLNRGSRETDPDRRWQLISWWQIYGWEWWWRWLWRQSLPQWKLEGNTGKMLEGGLFLFSQKWPNQSLKVKGKSISFLLMRVGIREAPFLQNGWIFGKFLKGGRGVVSDPKNIVAFFLH